MNNASSGEGLPTIFVVHPRENRKKCSIEPLRGRQGFAFWNFPRQGPEPLAGYVRLGIGGAPLAPADQGQGLLVLDGTWRLARKMEPDYAHLPVRSLWPQWQTAYPRVSKLYDDPLQGLATIEALFAAYVQMQRPVVSLLDDYFWKHEFLERNAEIIAASKTSASDP